MLHLARRARRIVAVVVPSLLTGALLTACGSAPPASAQAAGAALVPVEPAVTACALGVPLVSSTLDTVSKVLNGSMTAGSAGPVLAADEVRLRALADSTTDTFVQHALQDLVDALAAFRAVMADPSLGAYGDATTDGQAKARGFVATCPVSNPSFEQGTTGWGAGTSATSIRTVVPGRSSGTALALQNKGKSRATIGLTDSPRLVARTVQASRYRVGVWARVGADELSGKVDMALLVQEIAPNGTVRSSERAEVKGLTSSWAFLGVDLQVSAPGSALRIAAEVPDAAPSARILVDDFAVARG